MAELGEKTKKNLQESFAGESQARNKYTFFAKVARKQGFNYIAKIFEETAANEMQHAKEEFKLLKGIGSTEDNLQAAIDGEHFETEEMYPRMAAEAKEEGNDEAEKLFTLIAKIEKHHEERYKQLLELVKSEKVFEREEDIVWKCEKCGHLHKGKKPPEECPSCKHSFNYFEPSDICEF
ncbi:rubrerythrin [Candidatus Pacearchaeota archaeon]|jgi:rubrerythrin|nr:rubrerythrin [Candidatus Pacearchaeota archaeon]|tara:strand:+ start:2180 stop:2716 length:537 start_codon:yes stop_codon:yes gene_type:complete